MSIRTSGRFIVPILIFTMLAHNAVAQNATDLCEKTLESGSYGNVARAIFTSNVSNREPMDQLTTWDPNRNVVYFFTEILNGTGTRVTHRWLENGQSVAELHFNIGGARWRVWSSRRYVGQEGEEWTVEVIDDRGCSLGRWSIEAKPEPPPKPEPDLPIQATVDAIPAPLPPEPEPEEPVEVDEYGQQTIESSTEEEVKLVAERETESGSRYSYGAAGRLEINYTEVDDDISPFESGGYARRARITGSVTAGDHWQSKVTYDFDAEAWILAIVGYKFRRGELIAGQFKNEFSLENMMSTTWQPLLERSSAFGLGVLRGLGVGYATNSNQWSFHVAIQSGDMNSGDLGSPKRYSARLTHAFVRKKGAILHAGLSGLRQYLDDDGIARFQANPVFRTPGFIPVVVDTGNIPFSDYYDTVSFEFAGLKGPVSVQAEYIRTELERETVPDASFHGYYILASYFPWGGTRGYFIDKGVFGRPIFNSDRGAWEFAARYDRLDLNDGLITGGVQENWTLGVNFYRSFYRLTANYVDTTVTGGVNGNEDINAFTIMLQTRF